MLAARVLPRSVLHATSKGISITRRPVSRFLDRLEMRLHTWEVRLDPGASRWAREMRAADAAGELGFATSDDILSRLERIGAESRRTG